MNKLLPPSCREITGIETVPSEEIQMENISNNMNTNEGIELRDDAARITDQIFSDPGITAFEHPGTLIMQPEERSNNNLF